MVYTAIYGIWFAGNRRIHWLKNRFCNLKRVFVIQPSWEKHMPSLKLTCSLWKLVVGRRSFPFGRFLFSGANCSFKKSSDLRWAEIKIIYQINSRHSVFLAKFQIFFVGGDCSRERRRHKKGILKTTMDPDLPVRNAWKKKMSRWWFPFWIFTRKLEKMIPFWAYCSTGLKPVTSNKCLDCLKCCSIMKISTERALDITL